MSNNANYENLVTDAEPTPPKDKTEPDIQDKPPQKSKPKSEKKRSTEKNITNVITIQNANGIHIGPNISISVPKSHKNNQNCKSQVLMTEEISILMRRKDPLTRDIINFVSQHIGENWRFTCRHLDYSDGQIYQFEVLYHNVKEVVYKILLDWTQNKPDDSTVGSLVAALWDTDEKDVVQRLTVNLSKS